MLNLKQYKNLSCKCLVVGDIMLDRYIYGNVSRISPEAPVPVICIETQNCSLGGAANVAAGIHSLGAKVTLSGKIGKDDAAGIISSIFLEKGIDFKGIESKNCVTTTKTRIIGNGCQIARFDEEDTKGLKHDQEAFLLVDKCIKAAHEADVVVISDYNKGVCTASMCRAVIEFANMRKIPVIIDPKHCDWTRYMGAYLIAPNYKEFIEAAKYALSENIRDIEAAAKRLISMYDIENILITRSQDGMTLVNSSGIYNFHVTAKEVYDVSGAGDTVIAALSAFLAAGAQLTEAISISNIAAGIAVGKLGTYAVTFADLESKAHEKIYKENIFEAVRCWKKQGKKIIFTNGCFDIVHSGHISLLKQSKQFGDVLIVGLNTDASVRRLKGNSRPINNEADRAIILSAFEPVDAVVMFDEDTPLELIRKIMPDVLVKGDDYTLENVVGADEVISSGGKVELVKLVKEKSTTNIVRSIVSSQL